MGFDDLGELVDAPVQDIERVSLFEQLARRGDVSIPAPAHGCADQRIAERGDGVEVPEDLAGAAAAVQVVPVGHVEIGADRAGVAPALLEVPGDQGEAAIVRVFVPEVVMVLADGDAVPGDDAVPVIDQPVDGEVTPEGVDVGEIVFDRGDARRVVVLVREQGRGEVEEAGGGTIVGVAGDGFGESDGQARVGRRGRGGARACGRVDAGAALIFGEFVRGAGAGRPDFLVEHARAAVAEAVGHEAVVDVLGQREESERFAVEFETGVDGAGRGDAELAEEFVGEHLAHLRGVVFHGVEVDPLHAVEALARLVLVELDFVGELGAKLIALVVEAGEEDAEEALVAEADVFPALVAEPNGCADKLLGAGVGLEALELGGLDFDGVGAHLFDVEDVAARVAAGLVDAEADDIGGELGRRREVVVGSADADGGGEHGRGGEQGEEDARVRAVSDHGERLRDRDVNISECRPEHRPSHPSNRPPHGNVPRARSASIRWRRGGWSCWRRGSGRASRRIRPIRAG